MSSKRKTFIDADSIIYIASYKFKETYQYGHKILCLSTVDELIENILLATNAQQYAGFYGGSKGKNFRFEVATQKGYKATRKPPEPYIGYWKPIIKDHMRDKWKFTMVNKIEADDAVIICQHHFDNGTIASPDKDLRQEEGKVYDYLKQEHYNLSKFDAAYNLHYQLLIGDSTDNIPGCPGVDRQGADVSLEREAQTPFQAECELSGPCRAPGQGALSRGERSRRGQEEGSGKAAVWEEVKERRNGHTRPIIT